MPPKKRKSSLNNLRPEKKTYPEPVRPFVVSLDRGQDAEAQEEPKRPKASTTTVRRIKRVRQKISEKDKFDSYELYVRNCLDKNIPFEEDHSDARTEFSYETISVVSEPEPKQSKWDEFLRNPKFPPARFLNHLTTWEAHHDVKPTAQRTVKLVDILSDPPYTTTALQVHEIFQIILFGVNLAVAIADLVLEYNFLAFKFTALGLSLIDFTIMILSLPQIVEHYRCYNKESESSKKHHIYIQNIISEVLIYPLIILSFVGISVEQAFRFHGVMPGVSFVLVLADCADLLWTYTERMLIVHGLVRDLEKKIEENFYNKAGYVLRRCFIVIIGNTALFGIMLLMLFYRILVDNQEDPNFTITLRAGFYLADLIAFPILGIVCFVMANLHWIYECLIQIAILSSRKNDELKKNLGEKYDEEVVDVINFMSAKITATEERMNAFIKAKVYQKMLLPLTEYYVHIALLFWGFILFIQIAMAVFYIAEEPLTAGDIILLSLFCVMTVLTNFQAIILLILMPLFWIAGFLALLIGACYRCADREDEYDGLVDTIRVAKTPGSEATKLELEEYWEDENESFVKEDDDIMSDVGKRPEKDQDKPATGRVSNSSVVVQL